ncbi:carboxypeptidase A2-like [Anneissia japonica]|uniref:carboxypeptidase A2-like n=1 Tax=Anneissia japonica TaxID=1529436 RepID=UPI0014257B21|nr:carboxypeptidase A2-like [Anneissia japonica]
MLNIIYCNSWFIRLVSLRSNEMLSKVVLGLCLLAVVFGEQTRYDGYQVLRVKLNSKRELNVMHEIEKELGDNVEFWQSTRVLARPVDIMVKPKHQYYVKALLKAAGLQYEIMMDDIQKVIDDQREKMDGRMSSSDVASFDYSVYHTYEEYEFQQYTFKKKPKKTLFIIESQLKGSGMSGKPVVWFEGGIHAREWISPATVMYFTSKLLENYASDSDEEVRLLDGLDWLIVPSLNVDGYVFTWAENGDRLWRKTRSINQGTSCKGTDPNRNWDYKWGGEGASTWACSLTYRGSGPHSEVEIKAVTDYLMKVKKTQDVRVFVDWHSYSQLWLAPWSYSASAPDPENSRQLLALGDEAVAKIKEVHGSTYISGPSAQTLCK